MTSKDIKHMLTINYFSQNSFKHMVLFNFMEIKQKHGFFYLS